MKGTKPTVLLLAVGLGIVAIALAVKASTSDARFPVMVNGKFGYIDHAGKVVIPAQFDNAGLFDEGLAPVAQGKAWGYVDKSGKLVIAPQFDTPIPSPRAWH